MYDAIIPAETVIAIQLLRLFEAIQNIEFY